ncbi:MAG TPA: [Fe-Fe] hydrogenase large subunit C-terminal domain-containing protein [Bacteroidales bacterium]|nr:[Fe-Fe] hydrogenase large subunit C-terminal domain-containing protein [Bacteroidales bacterium]HPM92701.1 [Fe-Fe] hydrogenase large subunit C-terminal domain-containing protein [Bacteroidales bacterium]
MAHSKKYAKLVYTVKDRCRVCYTCVRECPVKAIRIFNGQAEVIAERCIACGNCVRVCSQDAKVFIDSREQVKIFLKGDRPVYAVIAPSFPAEFREIRDYRVLVGMIKKLGFEKVVEVSFGADMVAMEYNRLLGGNGGKHYISSDCPAIVNYVENYHPDLVPSLAPIVSPMVALCRVIRKKYGEEPLIVFIGPCIAKKAESDEIDEAITFRELRKLFQEFNVTPEQTQPAEFDEPVSGKGAIFPVSRGLLQTANKNDDLVEGNIMVADGRVNFREAIKEFENGLMNSQHLELLCCEGCIMGPGMTYGCKKFEGMALVSEYVREKMQNLDEEKWENQVEEFSGIDFSQQFSRKERTPLQAPKEKVDEVLFKMGKVSEKDQLNCGACGYDTCVDHAIAIVKGLAENEMCLPYAIEKLHTSLKDLNKSNEQLATTQQALRQSEKLASMGQLSAGIAHELNNPLGVITMYTNILKDETPPDSPVYKDLQLIVEQAERCRGIVGGLLNFARKNQVFLVETNTVDFVKRSVDSIIRPDNIDIKIENKLSDPIARIDKDQMMQVLTNLEKNAVEAMPKGGTLKISLTGTDHEVELAISDTGIGIPEENMEKIFTPFFTTKEVGKGTGLGLPLIYGIVKMHRGQVQVTSNADPWKGPTGTTFTIKIPR